MHREKCVAGYAISASSATFPRNVQIETVIRICQKMWIRYTVVGRNPAPPGMYKTLKIMGYLLHRLVQDFFHQQYEICFQVVKSVVSVFV